MTDSADADADAAGKSDGVSDVVGEAEADTADGVDHLGAGRYRFKLAAQVRKVDVHNVAVTDPARSPDGIKQFVTRTHLGGAAAELLEEREFDASGLRFFVINTDLTAAEVDGQRAEDKRRGADIIDTLLQLTRAAEHCVATGNEFINVEGSRNGVVRT